MLLLPPDDVLNAWGFAKSHIDVISVGLINATYRVHRPAREGHDVAFILQRLHPLFTAEVNSDIERITEHLALRGMRTPRLVRTNSDARFFVDEESRVWRVLSYIEGRCLTEFRTPSLAHAAGVIAGRFATATMDLDHTFAFTRPGVHDTAKHLRTLEAASATTTAFDEADEAKQLAESIMQFATSLPSVAGLPTRIVHGDLKTSNLLFDAARDEAICLVDLDTMQHSNVAIEMGDALRSWTNPKGENHARGEVDLQLFEAALTGYLSETRNWLSGDEKVGLAHGLEVIALELSARFCADVFQDSYFGWDSTRYASRRAHNLVRAQSQVSLAESARGLRGEMEALVRRLG